MRAAQKHSRTSSTFLFGLLCGGMLGACQDADPANPPAESPTWQVKDGFLRAPDGRAVILRGANVSGQQKNTPYLDASNPEDYSRLRTVFGMNAARFLMTWAAVEPEAGHYDDAYLDAVAVRLDWAQAAGLTVILDMHEDIYGEGFGFDGAPRWACDEARYKAFQRRDPWFLNSLEPNVQACVDSFFTDETTLERFRNAWVHVAQRLSSAPAVIGFDVLNEPSWGSYAITSFEADRLQSFFERLVPAVRQEAPNWVAFLEPAASRNLGISTGLSPFPFPNVMYSPHSYDSAAESGGGFDPTRRDSILDNINALAAEATALGAGLWIGEYGGGVEAPGYADYMRAQYDGASAVCAGTMYWDYSRGGDYSMLATDGTPRPAAVAALVRPYPERIAGTPQHFAFEASSSTFRFSYMPNRLLDAPTEVVVPGSLYPQGYSVSCGGCSFEKQPGRLEITSIPAEGQVELVVSPSP